jgi:FkbM family methyltransferase
MLSGSRRSCGISKRLLAQPGWRVVEIGGNVGIYALLCAARGARVETYEPGPAAFARLMSNAAGWPITCHHAAVVGVPRKSATLYLHPLRDTRHTLLGEIGGVSNTARGNGGAAGVAHAGTVEVPAVPIAQVLDAPCDLLKVACEGAEFEILMNAGLCLANAARMVIELHSELHTTFGGAPELIVTLRDAGFEVVAQQPYPGTSRHFLTARRLGGRSC